VDDAEELRAARTRLVSELLSERRRVERALHDGIQQDLTALAVELQLAAASPERLEALRSDIHVALAEVRSVADGLYPSLLDAGGLAAALPGVAKRAGVALRLTVADAPRAAPAAEAALLFACRAVFEAAPGGAEVSVSLRADETRLRAELEPVDVLPPLARDLVLGAGGSVEAGAGRVVLTV
jgi:signal transduction histidine kinase